jgi:hypothetical protein
MYELFIIVSRCICKPTTGSIRINLTQIPADISVSLNIAKSNHILLNGNLILNKIPISNILVNSMRPGNLINSSVPHPTLNITNPSNMEMVSLANHTTHRLLISRVIQDNREAGLPIINKTLIKINQVNHNGDPNRLNHHSEQEVSNHLMLLNSLGMVIDSFRRTVILSSKIRQVEANTLQEEIQDIRIINRNSLWHSLTLYWLVRKDIIPAVSQIKPRCAGLMTIEMVDPLKEDKIITILLTEDSLDLMVVNHRMTTIIKEVEDERETDQGIKEIDSVRKTRKKLRKS